MYNFVVVNKNTNPVAASYTFITYEYAYATSIKRIYMSKKKRTPAWKKTRTRLFYHHKGTDPNAGKIPEVEGERSNSPAALIAMIVTVIAVFFDLNLPPLIGAALSIISMLICWVSLHRAEPLQRLAKALILINIVLLCVHIGIFIWTVHTLSQAGFSLF